MVKICICFLSTEISGEHKSIDKIFVVYKELEGRGSGKVFFSASEREKV
jgi:hypothetical protein